MAWSELLSEGVEESCFELYHENSKIGRRVRPSPLLRTGATAVGELDDEQYPLFNIGEAEPAANPVGVAARKPPFTPGAGRLSMKLLAALLAAPASLDVEPIELYAHIRAVDGLPAGLYRLGGKGAARLIRRGDLGRDLRATLIAPPSAGAAALQIVIAGAFARAAMTDGERGYRRALIAAGARARTIELIAGSLGLGVTGVTDFYDRELDALLGLDGIDVGALVLLAVGPAA